MYYFLSDNHNSRNQAIESKNAYDRTQCKNCRANRITYKGIYNFKIMGKLYDCYVSGGSFVISEKFLKVLRDNGFTGYEVSETMPRYGTVTMVGDPIKEKYYLLKVTGRCGLLCDLNGEPLPYCRKCGRWIGCTGLVTEGVSFVPESYDGSDLFAFDNLSSIPIVSEEIKEVLVKSKLTNLRFVPLTDHLYKEPMGKEKAIEWIKEGVAYPELIEAWLKYGVIDKETLSSVQQNINSDLS